MVKLMTGTTILALGFLIPGVSGAFMPPPTGCDNEKCTPSSLAERSRARSLPEVQPEKIEAERQKAKARAMTIDNIKTRQEIKKGPDFQRDLYFKRLFQKNLQQYQNALHGLKSTAFLTQQEQRRKSQELRQAQIKAAQKKFVSNQDSGLSDDTEQKPGQPKKPLEMVKPSPRNRNPSLSQERNFQRWRAWKADRRRLASLRRRARSGAAKNKRWRRHFMGNMGEKWLAQRQAEFERNLNRFRTVRTKASERIQKLKQRRNSWRKTSQKPNSEQEN